jgi:hypothetical protein
VLLRIQKGQTPANHFCVHSLYATLMGKTHPAHTHLDEFVAGNPVRDLALPVDQLKRHFLARGVRWAHCDVEA